LRDLKQHLSDEVIPKEIPNGCADAASARCNGNADNCAGTSGSGQWTDNPATTGSLGERLRDIKAKHGTSSTEYTSYLALAHRTGQVESVTFTFAVIMKVAAVQWESGLFQFGETAASSAANRIYEPLHVSAYVERLDPRSAASGPLRTTKPPRVASIPCTLRRPLRRPIVWPSHIVVAAGNLLISNTAQQRRLQVLVAVQSNANPYRRQLSSRDRARLHSPVTALGTLSAGRLRTFEIFSATPTGWSCFVGQLCLYTTSAGPL